MYIKRAGNAITKQYAALLEADNVTIKYTDDGIDAIADIAFTVNSSNENIGARRLHTIMEKLVEDIAFEAPEGATGEITIDATYVQDKLGEISTNVDLSKYIL